MFSPKEVLAAKLSGAGIRVTCGYLSGSMMISKTISMSNRYADIATYRPILDDSISTCSRTHISIDKKKFVKKIVQEGIGDGDFAKRMYSQFIKGHDSGLRETGLDSNAFPKICKRYFFLCKSQEFTSSLNELVNEYLNCKLGDWDSQKEILIKIKDEVCLIANDLHLSLTLEKDAMDTYYLLPLLRQEKMDKAIKGIYKTSEVQMQEALEVLAKYNEENSF